MKRILFICDLKYPELWKDGLWAALEILKKSYNLSIFNLRSGIDTWEKSFQQQTFDFILGWGAFRSPVDNFIHNAYASTPHGLCIGGTAMPMCDDYNYDVLFHETKWYRKSVLKDWIDMGGYAVHAFGVNTNVYWYFNDSLKIIDWLSVGALSIWKRQHLLKEKKGVRLLIGEVQQENLPESMSIANDLIKNGVGIMDMVSPKVLAHFYNQSKNVLVPCELHGGGERAVLEARSCGCNVEVMDDNPKLIELIDSPVYDHYYYAKQLEEGLEYVFKQRGE